MSSRRATMTLFSAPDDPWSHRTRIVIAEKAIDIEGAPRKVIAAKPALPVDSDGLGNAEGKELRFGVAASVPDKFRAAITCFEDRRFTFHPGVDPLALARAAGLNLRLLEQAARSREENDLPVGTGDLLEVSVFEVEELS